MYVCTYIYAQSFFVLTIIFIIMYACGNVQFYINWIVTPIGEIIMHFTIFVKIWERFCIPYAKCLL